jgi:cell division protein FtsB
MVIRPKLRSLVTTCSLYLGAVFLIAYFGVNAFTGNHGLRAQQHLDQNYASLRAELDQLKKQRAEWQHRVKLLRSNSIDPDMLDERARAGLNYLDPRDVTLMLKPP